MLQNYDGYELYKNWRFFEDLPADSVFVNTYIIPAEVRCKRVYELGFGAGGLLKKFKNLGAEVAGYEINPALNKAAIEHGVFIKKPEDLQSGESNYDFILALDVFEHLSIDNIIATLHFFKKMMHQKTKLIIRFPNCASPLSSPYQYGDLTHTSYLSVEKIKQIIFREDLGLNVKNLSNFKEIFHLKPGAKIRLVFLLVLQCILAIALGKKVDEMSPNSVVEITLK